MRTEQNFAKTRARPCKCLRGPRAGECRCGALRAVFAFGGALCPFRGCCLSCGGWLACRVRLVSPVAVRCSLCAVIRSGGRLPLPLPRVWVFWRPVFGSVRWRVCGRSGLAVARWCSCLCAGAGFPSGAVRPRSFGSAVCLVLLLRAGLGRGWLVAAERVVLVRFVCAWCGARAFRCGRCAVGGARGPLACSRCGCGRCGWRWSRGFGRFVPLGRPCSVWRGLWFRCPGWVLVRG